MEGAECGVRGCGVMVRCGMREWGGWRVMVLWRCGCAIRGDWDGDGGYGMGMEDIGWDGLG